MNRFDLLKLMTAIVYAGACHELKGINDEVGRKIRREQLMREARDVAHRIDSGNFNLSE
jgi:hypothetical protein